MAVKDKLVTLEDLKTAYDKLKEMLDMYEDITSSLTWSNATWTPTYDRTKDTTASMIAGVKMTKISVSKGEKFKVYGWFNKGNSSTDVKTIVFALADANDAIVSATGEYPEVLPTSNISSAKEISTIHFGESRIAVPAKAEYLYIFDYAGHSSIGATAGDIIVEKAL